MVLLSFVLFSLYLVGVVKSSHYEDFMRQSKSYGIIWKIRFNKLSLPRACSKQVFEY